MAENQKKGATPMQTNKPTPTLTLDVELYQHYLDNADLSEEQKIELLETLWQIICGFVQMGFIVHPVQQALSENSGKDAITALTPTYGDSPALESSEGH
jgi:hypothetical protein